MILILLLFIIGGMLGLLPQPLFVLSSQTILVILEKAGIAYRTKARDLSSPSLFSMGTRERAGTAFQKVNYQTLYTIYVRKADYERAVHVILA